MATFQYLSKTEKNEHHKNIFSLLAEHEKQQLTQDGASILTLDSSELELIRNEQHEIVKENLARSGSFQTATELKEKLLIKTQDMINDHVAQVRNAITMENKKGVVNDGYYNAVSGIGTMIDPGMSTETFVPVSITPTEATAYYANGGIPARIIDKKAGCLLLSGLKFKCNDFSPEDITRLEEYADKCGFTDAYREGVTQALIFGGAAVYPMFTADSPITTEMGKLELLKTLPEKDFIKYWVTADRWNVVFVPDYNITAQDYLYARSIFVPLGGMRVNTQRVAMVRPRKLPYWGAIQQMGWSTSEFEGWIKDYESYEIMKMSLPIMAQQMSLMYHSIPADGLIIENGPEYAKQFFKENESQMRQWSMLHPMAINSVGEIKILERTYTGFNQIINEARLALCASAGMQESIIFAERPSGLASDNKDDIELKQSESIRLLFNNVAPSFKNCIEFLVYSCFGKNSEQAKYAKNVQIAPDNAIILSDMDKSNLGQAFSTIAGQLVASGASFEGALKVASKFVPSAELDEDTFNALLGMAESQGVDTSLWEQINNYIGGKK